MTPGHSTLERRVRLVRARARVRRWEYRQRHGAHGVWFRLRRFLAFSAEAWVLPDPEVRTLLAEGYEPDPVGRELEPPKILLRVSRDRLERLQGLRSIPVSLGPELLAAPAVVTVGFDLCRPTPLSPSAPAER